MFVLCMGFKVLAGKGETMESRVGIKAVSSAVLRPEIVRQIRSQGAEIVCSNWRTMAKVLRRKAELKPNEDSSRVAQNVARKYEQEAELIAEYGL